MTQNERIQELGHGAQVYARRRKKQGFSQRMAALTMSAVLFGSVAAGTFYGVNALLPQENIQMTSVSAESAGAVLTSLASTSYSGTRYGMDVSDIAAAALPSVVSITNISVQEVQSFFNRFGPNGAGQIQLRETTICGSGTIIANDGTWLYIRCIVGTLHHLLAHTIHFQFPHRGPQLPNGKTNYRELHHASA